MRFLCLPLAAITLAAQTPAVAPRPKAFDVATIRASDDLSGNSRTSLRPGGRIEATNVTLLRMIMAAYDVTELQIVDAPDWVSQARWNLEAKADGMPADPKPDQVLPLLRALLEERFQLKVRRTQRPMAVYQLLVDRTGSKLQASTEEGLDSASTRNSPKGMTLEAKRMGMGTFAQQMSRRAGRPVVDRTGLTAVYDFKLEWTPELAGAEPAAEPAGPSLFTAIREQLGLRLEAARDSVDVLVIEHAERPGQN